MEAEKINLTVALSDILKVRERIKLICLLGFVFVFVSFAESVLFPTFGLKLMLAGIFILIFGVFYALNEKESERIALKLGKKIKKVMAGF